MIKFTVLENPNGACIRLEGRLDEGALAQLAEALGAGSRPALDLSGLTSVDDKARDFLATLAKSGIRVFGASLYIRRILEEAQH